MLDGELVVYREGRCDFAALQRRVSGRPSLALAASFVAFDILTVAGRDLRGLPYRTRRNQLRRLLADAAPPLALMPATRELDGAQAWMHNHTEAGVEGVVVSIASTVIGPGAVAGGRSGLGPPRTPSSAVCSGP